MVGRLGDGSVLLPSVGCWRSQLRALQPAQVKDAEGVENPSGTPWL